MAGSRDESAALDDKIVQGKRKAVRKQRFGIIRSARQEVEACIGSPGGAAAVSAFEANEFPTGEAKAGLA